MGKALARLAEHIQPGGIFGIFVNRKLHHPNFLRVLGKNAVVSFFLFFYSQQY